MNIIKIIEHKRDKKELTKEEIEYFVTNYTNGNIPEYQAAALIMAIYLNGMTEREITDLSIAMAYSGKVLDLSELNSIIVDKHSTGGVGDKVSLILMPLVASVGVPVAKMSGRGLGFTGGTADKLEAIPGYNTDIDTKIFIQNVKEIGISMITQDKDLDPADKKIYALRDVISCVDSIPLIASSIMSKKIASGAQKIVIDVTVGKGAFMKNKDEAKKLSEIMIKIGELADKETVCIMTDMDEPLGYAVGNSLEVIEAIQFLKGDKIIEDLKNVVLELGANMIKLAGKGDSIEENKELLMENIRNKKAFNKFKEMVKKQGGDISYIEDENKFPKAKYIEKVFAEGKGVIEEINAKEIGELSSYLGAGRLEKDDKIDYAVGIVLKKKVGEIVNNNEELAEIHANSEEKLINAKNKILEIIKIK